MTFNLIILFSIFFIKKGLCYFCCLNFNQFLYVFFCNNFFFIQIHMEKNLFCRCVWKWRFCRIELHKNSVVLFFFSLQFIRSFLKFIFVPNYKMLTFFPVPVPINVWNKDKLSSFRVVNTVPLLNQEFFIVIFTLHWNKRYNNFES